MHDLPGARGVAGFFLTMALLAGCGGGSGGDESARTEISTNAISFSAAAPDAATPASQVITATFGSDIAHLAVVHSGTAVGNVTSTMNGRTATITVDPAAPSSIGPGAFVGAVAVTGYTCADATCSKLAAGTTSTVSISYQISPVVQVVTPYAETAGVSDEVIIRGVGFTSFNGIGVRFGDVAATSVTPVSPTEIRATHPALAAGTYPVRLTATDFQGEITSTATLVVVDPTAYAATTLSYPTALSEIRRLIYDHERRALLVLTDVDAGSVVRYQYNGTTWGAPTEVRPGPGLVDATLSAKGTSLYGITPTSFVPVDPVTLALGTAVAAPSLASGSFLKNIVVGNDDVALITTGINASSTTNAYLYFPLSSTFLASNALNNATPAMAANGSGAYLIQGDPTLTAEIQAAKYTTSSNSISGAVTSLRQSGLPPVISRTANRLVLNTARVYDAAESFQGTLPLTTNAVVLKPDGTRAYTYDSTAGGILVFDISVDRDEAAYVALGPVVPLVGDPGGNPKMVISPDGRTLFVAGRNQVVVQPTPAL